MSILDSLKANISKEDFIIRIRPMLDKYNSWTGQVDITIVTFPENPLDDDDYSQLTHFSKMVCSSVPIMEEVEQVREMFHNYAMAQDEVIVDMEESNEVEKTYDGNIVHIRFDTDTKGSA
ncbi:MAG: hypothetical protein CBB98_09740 [Rhodobacteraceae bacterium TMED38]|nr:MAG: hypothetical protein CBB98_09740 [Rhodobacteraceae bacterium TMED38]|tara:strand:- start:7023 stop:7382 length:360 start_codon:yes stop_codon:yes gene_type:complete